MNILDNVYLRYFAKSDRTQIKLNEELFAGDVPLHELIDDGIVKIEECLHDPHYINIKLTKKGKDLLPIIKL